MTATAPRDARVRELEFLSRVERQGAVGTISDGLLKDDLQKQMIAHLLYEGYLNGVESLPWGPGSWLSTAPTEMPGKVELRRWYEMKTLLAEQQLPLSLSHKGRVRISELRDELRAGKYRDPSGLLWSVRHLDRDLIVAVTEAAEAAPVSLAVVDMNGLKPINDNYGYAAGNAVIEAYLRVIATFTGDGVDGYRGDSSDEVYLILRATTTDQARKTIELIMTRLAGERVEFEGKVLVDRLTACAGITTRANPEHDSSVLRRKAEQLLMGAKQKSKSIPARESVIEQK